MRTFDEIFADIGRAVALREVDTIWRYTDEMARIGSREATAAAANAKAVALSWSGDYRDSLAEYQRALALYEELGDGNGIARVVGGMALEYSYLGQVELALECYQRALDIHYELDDLLNVAVVTGNIGTEFLRQARYKEALESFEKSLRLYIDQNERSGEAVCLSNIGSVYLHIGDYPRAMEHYQRSLDIRVANADQHGIATICVDIGHVYELTGNLTGALEQYTAALEAFRNLQDPAETASVVSIIGRLHLELGNLPAALTHLREALASFETLDRRIDVQGTKTALIEALLRSSLIDEAQTLIESENIAELETPQTRAKSLANRAFLYQLQGAHEAAQSCLLQALNMVSEVGIRSLEARYHGQLRDLAQQRNDFAAYIEHNNEYQRITEEIRGKETTQRLTMMEAERTMEAERRERDKERALLYGALPKTVAERMVRGETVSGDHFTHAAVLFADIAGFTSNSANLDASDVVTLLGQVFHEFDRICERHGVTKVKTIGDAYMCFKGDSSAEENAQAVAHVALAIVRTTFTWPTGAPLSFRVGIHIGQATAGVIGTQRLQYDVWGDTVNVASRMESTGEPGRIHVTEAFAEGATPHTSPVNAPHTFAFTFIERGEIDIKGKGTMNTYWLETP